MIENPNNIFMDIKKMLKKSIQDRKHGFHQVLFSNITKNKEISSRIVILRNFLPRSMILDFHSDIRSKKINDIKLNPKTYFVFYDSKLKIQLRINTSTKIEYKNKTAKTAWNNTKIMSRKCYLTQYSPSSVINSFTDGLPDHLIGKEPSLIESEKGYTNFAVISSKIKSIDWLHLSSNGHRRIKFTIKNKNVYHQWIAP